MLERRLVAEWLPNGAHSAMIPQELHKRCCHKALAIVHLYKKIDSALKGNWCIALEALFQAVVPRRMYIGTVRHRVFESSVKLNLRFLWDNGLEDV